jgi:HAD superfamily hydrolase (TIGR01509 family)
VTTAYPYAAVLFDMDGTLIDNIALQQAVWREFTRREGLDRSDAQLDFAKGRKAVEVVEQLWPSALPAEVSRLTAERQELYRSRLADSDLVHPIAGAEPFLAALGALGVVRMLATDAPRANVEAALRRFRLASYFEGMVTSDVVQHGKPHPEIFLAAATRAKVAPDRCLVAEDSPAGVAAAKAAGCACLGLATNQSEADLRREGVDYVAVDYLRLPAKIAAVRSE